MLSLRKIAITGGLAAGKSTVCRILQEEYSAFVIDADKIVHQLLSPHTEVGQKVIHLLGHEIVAGNQIDRKKISNIVFSDPKKLDALESILHPAVREEIEREFNQVKSKPSYRFFVAEIPLLYEAKMEHEFDTVIAVIADERYASPDDFEKRLSRQLPSHTKAQKADFVIQNNGDLTSLRSAIQSIVDQLQKENQ